jgi:uncharacterized protein (DUF302 family)
MQMSIDFHLNCDLETAIEKITAALKAVGFGVLSRIDVHTTFKEKLDEDFREYVMLGACSPKLAWKAFNHESRVGLMLPCNITVEAAEGGGMDVKMIHPDMLLGMGGFAEDPVFRELRDHATPIFEQLAADLGE